MIIIAEKRKHSIVNTNAIYFPTPLVVQSLAPPKSGAGFEVWTTMCCMSRHVSEGFASSAKAHNPAAKGADADVPVCYTIQEMMGEWERESGSGRG